MFGNRSREGRIRFCGDTGRGKRLLSTSPSEAQSRSRSPVHRTVGLVVKGYQSSLPLRSLVNCVRRYAHLNSLPLSPSRSLSPDTLSVVNSLAGSCCSPRSWKPLESSHEPSSPVIPPRSPSAPAEENQKMWPKAKVQLVAQ